MASVAVITVAAQLLALAHLVIVRHERCPEHGELVHSRVHTGGEAVVRTPAASEAIRVLPTRVRSSESEHDHCSVINERRVDHGRQLIARAAPVADHSTMAPDSSPPWRLVYQIAPKNSPPPIA